MSDKAYPDFEPAWVQDPEGGPDVLWWLGQDGMPLEPIGVDRETDVPGLHTPEAALRIAAMSQEAQADRAWPE